MNLFLKKYSPLLVFLAAMLWATDAPFRTYLTKDLSSTFIVFVEHFLNLVFVLPLLWISRKSIKKLSLMDWFFVIGVGVGGSALASIAFTEAFYYVNPSVAILLQKLQPIITIFLAWVFLDEKLTKKFFVWAGIALCGAYLISFPNLTPQLYDGEVWNPNILGVGCALLAAILWGSSTVFGKHLLNKITFEGLTALRFVVGFMFLLGLNVWSGDMRQFAVISSTDVLFLVITSIVSGSMSLLLYYRGLQYTKASIATLAELGFVFASLVINYLFLDTSLVYLQVAGVILLLLSILNLVKLNR